ncbi:hypothetical protein GCM10010293_36780 [Streptomyces griseoflavus]|uniref:hypothetical protein n=1 Tax=Streptomyces griseoflavus TaxID=35619 RepID=UPI00167EC220|nr:hypothetical protein [Streptomyces griseoflavus]GGV34341.1 hypothetical protein GCM10010293_36780 [Streptomyces griseoflavus]
MAQGTQSEHTEDTPQGYGFCSWHNRFSAGVRLIDVVEQGSGSGGVQYACEPCRERHGLVPFADR